MRGWTDRGRFTGFTSQHKCHFFFLADYAGLPDFFFKIVDCVAFLYKRLHIKTSTLCVATYIYTYSGDAPMNARWVFFFYVWSIHLLQTNTNQWSRWICRATFFCFGEVVGNCVHVLPLDLLATSHTLTKLTSFVFSKLPLMYMVYIWRPFVLPPSTFIQMFKSLECAVSIARLYFKC